MNIRAGCMKKIFINFVIYGMIALFISIAFSISFNIIPNMINKRQNQDRIKKEETRIIVTREDSNGLNNQHLQDLEVIKLLEKMLLEKIIDKSEKAFFAQGGKGELNPSFKTESWVVESHNQNFVIFRIKSDDLRLSETGQIQSTIIIGIKNNTLIKISGVSRGIDIIPHSYGAIAEKMKNEFGFSL